MTVAKKSKGQKIAFVFSCILPVVILLLAVLLLLGDAVPNLAFILAHLVLPIGVILLQRFTLFSKMRIWLKAIISFLLIGFLIVAFAHIAQTEFILLFPSENGGFGFFGTAEEGKDHKTGQKE